VTGSYIADIAAEIQAAVPPKSLPAGDTSDLFLIYAVLALAKGVDVEARDIHNAWAAWMSTKDPQHESIVPYDALSPDVRREDDPYLAAVRRVAHRLGRSATRREHGSDAKRS
jgi:hypothetical protein